MANRSRCERRDRRGVLISLTITAMVSTSCARTPSEPPGGGGTATPSIFPRAEVPGVREEEQSHGCSENQTSITPGTLRVSISARRRSFVSLGPVSVTTPSAMEAW